MDAYRIGSTEWIRHFVTKVTVIIAPATGRRRVWSRVRELEEQLAAANAEIITLKTDAETRERFVNKLMNDGVVYRSHIRDLNKVIEDLDERLTIAIHANEANERMVSFDFMSRPIDVNNPLDQPTSAIPIQELRDDLSRDEPVTGKVQQYNPETGAHETVETRLNPESPDLVKLRAAIESQGAKLGRVTLVGQPVTRLAPAPWIDGASTVTLKMVS